ncbi:MAG TPA: tripartite tricarboxylate transporter TctB family protein [Firmicutes bacterium]|nr:tripartite tricarboxylate transporter TctB family protein [Bacillota bacterium]
MKRWQRVGAYVLLLVALVVIQQSIMALHIVSYGQPGSGLFPLILGLGLAAFAIVILLQNQGADEEKVPFWQSGSWLRPLLAFVALVAYGLMLERLGYLAAIFIFVAFWLFVVEGKGIVAGIIGGVLSSLAIHVVFGILLKVPLPGGFWR